MTSSVSSRLLPWLIGELPLQHEYSSHEAMRKLSGGLEYAVALRGVGPRIYSDNQNRRVSLLSEIALQKKMGQHNNYCVGSLGTSGSYFAIHIMISRQCHNSRPC